MSKYVSQEEMLEILNNDNFTPSRKEERLRGLKTIEPKQGEWIWVDCECRCSECHTEAVISDEMEMQTSDFCPNCGAQMVNNTIKEPNDVIEKKNDVIKVVRCKDCKHCTEHYDTDGNVPYWTCSEWDSGTDADGFCYLAERRTDERYE